MPAYKFSPNLASPEERRETFVAREAIHEDLLDRVRKLESGARHCILIGPRGIGKTHLLLLLADSIEADETLASRWVVVRFAEEEYSITSLAELLLRVIESLPNNTSKNIGRDVDLALAHILDFCANSGKRVLLLLDNIQLYFNQFPNADIGRMRDILMSKSAFLIVGAAPSYFKQMTGYEEPFYNFFEPIHLSELTSEEAEEMLRLRAEFENSQEFLERFDQCRPKIRTTARLTGGNPRLILMLYQVMCESGVTEAAEAFKRLLDELTPYFQGRMDGLAPQGRKVLDTLASMESPATPTELAKAAGMQVNAVTSQLKRLRDGGFIQQVKLRRSKTTRYEVTERLFRMWREMRTETGRTRLGFLIRFLNLWYTPRQLLDETEKLLTQLGEAQRREKSRLLLHLQYLKEAAPELLWPELERVYSYAEVGRLELVAAEIPPLKELASLEEYVNANPDDATVWRYRGVVLGNLGRHEEALESYDKAIQLQPDDATAWSNRGVALGNLGKHHEALESLKKAVELANAQNLEETSEFAASLAAETELSTSLQDLAEDNLGSARRALKNAVESGKQADAEYLQLLVFGYLKGALKSGKIQFAQEAIEIIVSGIGEEYKELLRPFRIALEYMQTEDVSILERLQQEERELVLEIAGQTKVR